MKKDIRKALIEVKERKDIFLLEKNIAEKRIMMIVESKRNLHNFEKVPYEKRLKMSFQLMREFAYLQENSLILEQGGFLDMMKGIFGGNIFQNLFSGSIETIAEPILDSLFNKIGFKSQGFIKKFMISFLTTRPSKLIAAFTDCKEFTKLFSESLVEAIIMLIQDQTNTGSFAFDFVRNTLGGYIKDTSFISGIEDKVAGSVCGFFDSYTEKAKNVIDKLKPEEKKV
jgi:hypothetical protein